MTTATAAFKKIELEPNADRRAGAARNIIVTKSDGKRHLLSFDRCIEAAFQPDAELAADYLSILVEAMRVGGLSYDVVREFDGDADNGIHWYAINIVSPLEWDARRENVRVDNYTLNSRSMRLGTPVYKGHGSADADGRRKAVAIAAERLGFPERAL